MAKYVCTVCGWMRPGFYMDGEMVLSWDEMKEMGYAEVQEDGRLLEVSGNLDGLLVIGEDVTKLDGNLYSLFKGTPLQEVWIPRTVTDLGRYLVAGTSIREVRLFCPVTVLQNNAFSESLNNPACLESVWLPDTLVEIGNNAFEKCTALTHLDLPASVEKLGYAFIYDNGLTSLQLPPHLKDVSSAFYSSRLQQVILPATVEKIGSFSYCDASVIDLSATQVTAIPDKCFQYCYNLETLRLPAGLQTFGYGCFADNRSLKQLELPDGLKSLGNTWLENIETLVWPVSLIDVNGHQPEHLSTIYYRGTEKQWKLNGANNKWDLSGVTVICNFTGTLD